MNKKYKTIFVNFVYNYFYQILLVIIPLFTSPYVTRIFSTDVLGEYTYYYTIATYFALVAMLGINNYGNRTVAIVKNDPNELNKVFSEIFVIQIFSSIIILLIYSVMYFMAENSTSKLFILVAGLYVLSSLFDLNWLFFGLEKFKLTVTKNVIVKLATAICIFLFVKSEDDIYLYGLLMCGSFVISNLALLPYVVKHIKFCRPCVRELKKHIKPILILFVPVIATSIYKYMDKIMLGKIVGMTEVSMYDYAEKLNSIPSGIVGALGTVMLPRASSMIHDGETKEASKILNASMLAIAFITPAMAFGISSISPELAPLFLGKSYERCGIVMQYISFMLIFISTNNVVRTQAIIPYKKDIPYIVALGSGALCNLICNLLLIPRFGAVGAAIGTVAAEFSVFVVQAFFTKNLIRYDNYFKMLLCSMVIGLVMFVTLRRYIFMESEAMEILVRIFVGMQFYVIPACVYFVVKRIKRKKTNS